MSKADEYIATTHLVSGFAKLYDLYRLISLDCVEHIRGYTELFKGVGSNVVGKLERWNTLKVDSIVEVNNEQ